jgi:tRNA nucleotidyltransferase/poly(A) polymerase
MSEVFERARLVASRLRDAGHEVYFAGGCVRDQLLGREPADVDIATSATPDEVQKIFRRTIAVGKQFGVIIVQDGELQFDVATFRRDGAYGDGRRPDAIEFSSAEEDVARRDFSINGLLMEPDSGEVVDFVGGLADLRAGIIRTIGNPRDRFGEDRLRILRAIRFATRLGFEIEGETAEAMRALAPHAADPSAERIFSELSKMWTERAPALGLRLLIEHELLPHVLPAVAAKKDLQVAARLSLRGQDADGLSRSLRLLDRLEEGPQDPALVWAILLEDLPDGRGGCSWPQAAAAEASEILQALRASRELTRQVTALVAIRDRLLFCDEPSATRRALFSARDDLERLQAYRELALPDCPRPGRGAEAISARELPAPLLRGDALARRGLRGKAIGRMMRRLRVLQLNGALNTAAEAERWLSS